MKKISSICIFLVDSKHQTMSGLSFPMTAAVRDAIINYKNQKTNYVQLSINISKEIIELEDQTSCDSKSLPSRVPEGAPRYHLFRFDHTHEGDYLKSTSNLMFRNFCMYYMCIYFKILIYDFLFQPLFIPCLVITAPLKIECFMLVPKMPLLKSLRMMVLK